MTQKLPQQIDFIAFSTPNRTSLNSPINVTFAASTALLGEGNKYTVYSQYPDRGLVITEKVTYQTIIANKQLYTHRYQTTNNYAK
jgi:hypothetical protein